MPREKILLLLIAILSILLICGCSKKKKKKIVMNEGIWSSVSVSPITKRCLHAAVWTGSEMIIWGGGYYTGFTSVNLVYHKDGAVYYPSTDTWDTITESPVEGRDSCAYVWTGSDLIIWGGEKRDIQNDSISYYADGAGYNMEENSWSVLSYSLLSQRAGHTAVWTGSEMVIWGGEISENGYYSFYYDGAKYNPATDSWSLISPPPIAGRSNHTAIWTGNEMIIWGGEGGGSCYNDGASYNPAADTWTLIDRAPIDERVYHSAVWTGGEMIVWGGYYYSNETEAYYNDGAKYNPATDTWTVLSESPLSARDWFSCVWTGGKMIIWGGEQNLSSCLADGAAYNPEN
ncbi:MAG: hypothetical protein ABIH42_02440, partial [Planctomycetota bacterium]